MREDRKTVNGYGIHRRQPVSAVAVEKQPAGGGEREVLRGAMLAGWDYVATVPARGDSIYQTVVPTLCDSTINDGMCWSVFFVSAMTADPLTYWDSAPDSGYSVDNLPPCMPGSFLAEQAIYSVEAVDVNGNVSEPAVIMPDDFIETLLLDMSVSRKEDGVMVRWTLSRDSDAFVFTIGRAVDDGEFIPITGARIVRDGSSYTFTDHETEPGRVFSFACSSIEHCALVRIRRNGTAAIQAGYQ